jgi:osmotically-inducible protein OsmY
VLSAFARSDESIAGEVRQEVLYRTLAIDPESVTVTVEDAVTRLEGELETRSLGRILARLVQSVEGVVGVDDQLHWKLDDTHLNPEPPPLADRLSAGERE